MVKQVNVKVKQKIKRNKIGKGASISQKGKVAFIMSVPFDLTITMRQKTKNNDPNIKVKQRGSVTVASADKKTKEI